MNKLWIFACGEPLSIDDKNIRLHRAGKLGKYLAENKLFKIDFFTSTFNHVKKKNRFSNDRTINVSNNFCFHFLRTIPYKKNICVRRIISNFFLGLRLFSALKKQKEKPDLIYVSFPPIETSLAAVVYAKINKIKIIIDVRDLWPEIFLIRFNKLFKFFLKIFLIPFRIMTKYVFFHADSLMSISSEMLKWSQKYSNRSLIAKDKYIPFSYKDNFKSEIYKLDNNTINIKESLENKFNIVFIGNISKVLEFEDLCYSAKSLLNYKDIQFVICGSGDYLEEAKKLSENLKNIIFTNWINQKEINYILSNSKIGIIPYKNDFNISSGIPNKFSEYLCFGLPIISNVKGAISELILKNYIGKTYSAKKNLDLSNKILDLYNNKDLLNKYSNNCRKLFLNTFEENSNYEMFSKHLKYVYEM